MHATELPKPFHRDGWIYEEKYDGWRMVAEKVGNQVRLTSRNGLDHTKRFPELVKAVAARCRGSRSSREVTAKRLEVSTRVDSTHLAR